MKKKRYSSGRTHVPKPTNPYQYLRKLRVVDLSEARNTVGSYEIQILTAGHGWRFYEPVTGKEELATYLERQRAVGFEIEGDV